MEAQLQPTNDAMVVYTKCLTLPLKQAIVTATVRREPTIDFRSAPSADLAGCEDMEVLVTAMFMY